MKYRILSFALVFHTCAFAEATSPICDTGTQQSPIDIQGNIIKVKKHLAIEYKTIRADLVNTGHSLQENISDSKEAGAIIYQGKSYYLVQFHFHTPSENFINSEQYSGEIHFLNRDGNGETVVMAVLIRVGDTNYAFQKLIQDSNHNQINPVKLLPVNRSFYSFDGSLTTPPCTEGIHWIVMNMNITLSRQQISRLVKMIPHHHNARPIQPLLGRLIEFTEG